MHVYMLHVSITHVYMLCVYIYIYIYIHELHRWLSVKKSAFNPGDTRDMGSVLRLGRSPGVGKATHSICLTRNSHRQWSHGEFTGSQRVGHNWAHELYIYIHIHIYIYIHIICWKHWLQTEFSPIIWFYYLKKYFLVFLRHQYVLSLSSNPSLLF